ncbi:MAG: plasmid partition protein ParG [Cyanobacteria bacterium J06641_2]|uniref:plasmid partition protein ParG n=1 Tax=Rivularia sp. PCC 7116 TaxID=373994 RepID=UPI00031E17AD|nr:plasmid partition protein ParG [Rivularia sp. PCC 7116]
MSNLKNTEDKTVKLVVFLSDDERTQFKIACARSKTSMSQKAKELILAWVESEEEQSS